MMRALSCVQSTSRNYLSRAARRSITAVSKFIATVILTTALSASALLATAASKPLTKPKRVAASVTATFSSPVPLACTMGTSYAANCPGSSGACTCIDVGGTATGGFGRASVIGAITLDNFDATPENGCVPLFGSLALTAAASVTTMDINGSLCNATIPAGTKTLGGGFDFDPATVGLSGTGSISGTIDSSGTRKVRLIGAVAPAPTPSATATM